MGRLAPGYMPYNYGVSGYGPQQVYLRLHESPIQSEVSEKSGILIYLFIGQHVNRAIGSMNVHNFFGDITPYVTVDANDRLVHKGTMVTGRPFLSILYPIIGNFPFTKRFGYDIPRINDSHFAITARIIRGAREEYVRKFKNENFYVLLYPDNGSQFMAPFLQKEGVKYLNYGNLFDWRADLYHLPTDLHPSPRALQIIATHLVQDLQLN
jgi:hypothetical protein